MNPAWIHAAESLVPSLARGELIVNDKSQKNRKKNNYRLTEVQSQLRIPHHLVYMCGLVTFFQSEPPFSRQQTDWFQRLQILYQNEVDSMTNSDKNKVIPNKVYQLSPTLVPINNWRSLIHRHVSSRLIEIEAQAEAAFQKLLNMEDPATHNTGKRRTNSVKSNANASTSTTDSEGDSTHEDDQEDDLSCGFHCVNRSSITPECEAFVYEQTDENEDLVNDWTVVKAKQKSSSLGASVPCKKDDGCCKEKYANRNCLNLEGFESSPSIPPKSPQHRNFAWKDAQIHDREVLGESQVDSDAKTSGLGSTSQSTPALDELPLDKQVCNKGTPESNQDVTLLQNRIKQLELELKMKDEQLQRQQLAHSKALLQEKEQSHERLQSLQLRLYISETRLKAFEDALEQHIDAVANNMAIGSPERRVPRAQFQEEHKVATPLYSRALQK